MADQKLCDFCKQIINDKIYYLSITESYLKKLKDKLLEFVTLETALNLLNKKQDEYNQNTHHYEICENCKKVLDYLLTMRVDDLKRLQNEIDGIKQLPFKQEEENDQKRKD